MLVNVLTHIEHKILATILDDPSKLINSFLNQYDVSPLEVSNDCLEFQKYIIFHESSLKPAIKQELDYFKDFDIDWTTIEAEIVDPELENIKNSIYEKWNVHVDETHDKIMIPKIDIVNNLLEINKSLVIKNTRKLIKDLILETLENINPEMMVAQVSELVINKVIDKLKEDSKKYVNRTKFNKFLKDFNSKINFLRCKILDSILERPESYLINIEV